FALLSFLLHCPPLPRALPSFPTRRSSDLTSTSRPSHSSLRSAEIDSCSAIRRSSRAPFSASLTVSGHRNDFVSGRAEYLNRNALDRKSTRLNSSHVSISYAVFCLKKKKKN